MNFSVKIYTLNSYYIKSVDKFNKSSLKSICNSNYYLSFSTYINNKLSYFGSFSLIE